MEINIREVLEALKSDKTNKTRQSLEKLNETLIAYCDAGGRDFSITTIGRVSEEDGGLGYQSIRATANKHYRELIEAWAASFKTTTRKPTKTYQKTGQDYQLLERIPDTALRAVFGQIIRERDRYKTEANMLKSQTEIVIDKRPVHYSSIDAESSVELLPSLTGICSENEINALQYAVSDGCLDANGWNATALGQVKNEYGEQVFPRGFMTGLKKLLGEIDK